MQLPAPLAVAVEIRALDSGARADRVWRLSAAIGEAGVRLARALPFAAGRPVHVELRLPGHEAPLTATGKVHDAHAIGFTDLDAEARGQLRDYVIERTQSP